MTSKNVTGKGKGNCYSCEKSEHFTRDYYTRSQGKLSVK